MNILQKIALAFTIIGGINWGLVGLFDFNLVTAIFGVGSVMTTIIYVVIAIAAIINILILFMYIGERDEHDMYHHHSARHEYK
jgi:uncharacterized membrane protein YuzA (DUF378 family)